MGKLTILILALGLAMDAFAVSVTNGLCYKNYKRSQMLLTAFTFGLFQAMMPIIGYIIGSAFYSTIAFIDHWIALILLAVIGANMLMEGIKAYKNPEHSCKIETFSMKVLLVQGVATSIDALAIGISIAMTKTNVISSSTCIGIVTFICCYIGTKLGKKFDSLLKEKAEILGGLVLIAIGIKIFVEHTWF